MLAAAGEDVIRMTSHIHDQPFIR